MYVFVSTRVSFESQDLMYELQRNPKKLPIGHFLYEMQGARKCKREAIAAKEEQMAKSLSKCSYVTSQSWNYLKRLKLRAFKQMFGALDTDKVRIS